MYWWTIELVHRRSYPTGTFVGHCRDHPLTNARVALCHWLCLKPPWVLVGVNYPNMISPVIHTLKRFLASQTTLAWHSGQAVGI